MDPGDSVDYESVGSTSTSLIRRVKARDDEAWQRLVQLYGRLVLYWCRGAGLQRADRADVFQEVFRALAVHVAAFSHDQDHDSFRGWLRTITRSKVQDHFRRRQREPAGQGGSTVQARLQSIPDGAAEDDPLSLSDVATENALLVAQALRLAEADFEPQSWRAFWRTAVDGLTAEAAAAELGMSAAAVRKCKSRVLRRLRDEFTGLLGEVNFP